MKYWIQFVVHGQKSGSATYDFQLFFVADGGYYRKLKSYLGIFRPESLISFALGFAGFFLRFALFLLNYVLLMITKKGFEFLFFEFLFFQLNTAESLMSTFIAS